MARPPSFCQIDSTVTVAFLCVGGVIDGIGFFVGAVRGTSTSLGQVVDRPDSARHRVVMSTVGGGETLLGGGDL